MPIPDSLGLNVQLNLKNIPTGFSFVIRRLLRLDVRETHTKVLLVVRLMYPEGWILIINCGLELWDSTLNYT